MNVLVPIETMAMSQKHSFDPKGYFYFQLFMLKFRLDKIG